MTTIGNKVADSDIESSELIEDALVCKLCTTPEDFQVLSNFINTAKDEGYPFKNLIPLEQKALLLINASKKKYLGFLVWKKDPLDKRFINIKGLDFNEYKYKCCGEILQLIYIVKEERRKGFASKLIKYWVENIANHTYKMFGVELMGGSFILNVLMKLEYINKKDPQKSQCYLVGRG